MNTPESISRMIGLLIVISTSAAHAQSFVEVSKQVGIDYTQLSHENFNPALIEAVHETGGAAARDFDGDGWVDLIVTRMDASPILYKNVADPQIAGGRRFVDVTAGSGLENVLLTNGVAWGDVDNDGLADLYFTTFDLRFYLFMNRGEGKFVEEGQKRGAHLTIVPEKEIAHTGMSASFGDYDRDGYLDLATTEWLNQLVDNKGAPLKRSEMRRFQLLHNLGKSNPGYFQSVTDAAGVADFPGPLSVTFTPRFSDLDRDGWQDLIVTSDLQTSRLFWNKGDGTFLDGTASAAVGTDQSGMGSAVGDFDRDGDMDWFVTSISNAFGQTGNRLYLNRLVRPRGLPGMARSFADATDIGVRNGYWGWAGSFIDYDNDAWIDLVMTNGILHFPFAVEDPMRFFHNQGGATEKPTFEEVSQSLGLSDNRSGKGLLVFDFDNDGDQDIFVVNNLSQPLLYRNEVGSKNHWLKLQLVGIECNRDAAGAFVTVVDAQLGGVDRPLVWEVSCSSNYLAQNEPTCFFGLGKDFPGTIDSIRIEWPGGKEPQVLQDVPIDRFLRITQGRSDPVAVIP